MSITIKDYGPNISFETLNKLYINNSDTKNHKETKTGLMGLKNSIESIGGFLKIININNYGKTVTLSIPSIDYPKWAYHFSKIHQPILVLSNDDTIIQKIRNTVSPILSNKITYFKSEADFLINSKINKKFFLIIDYKYQIKGRDGLQLIVDEGLENRSLLLTSEVPNNRSLIKKASSLNIFLTSKDYLIINTIDA